MTHVRLSHAALTSLLLRDTPAGRVHDQRLAEPPPSPVPAGSRVRQALGWLAFMRDQVEGILPPQKPRGRALTRAPTAAHRRLACRRVRIAPGNRSRTRCRLVHDPRRRRNAGVRDRVMEVCCALQTFWVRLMPWHPMVSSE